MTGSEHGGRSDSPFPGITRLTVDADKATIVTYQFEPGSEFPLHSHPQDQITVVLAGSLSLHLPSGSTEYAAGDWTYSASDEVHGITAGAEGTTFIAVLVPPRASYASLHFDSEQPPE